MADGAVEHRCDRDRVLRHLLRGVSVLRDARAACHSGHTRYGRSTCRGFRQHGARDPAGDCGAACGRHRLRRHAHRQLRHVRLGGIHRRIRVVAAGLLARTSLRLRSESPSRRGGCLRRHRLPRNPACSPADALAAARLGCEPHLSVQPVLSRRSSAGVPAHIRLLPSPRGARSGRNSHYLLLACVARHAACSEWGSRR